MAKEKGKSSSSNDGGKQATKKKSHSPSIFSIFAVGVIVGVISGFLLGWWYPAPATVRSDIDSTKAATKEKMEDIARQARQKTADMLEDRARHLRQPLGHAVNDDQAVNDDRAVYDNSPQPIEPLQHESSVPIQ